MTPRLSAIHTALFVAGLLTLPLGVVLPRHGVFIVGGLCFAASGLLTILGFRIVMEGPMGRLLRRVVGGARLGGAYLVGAFWVLFGTVLVVVGLVMLGTSAPAPPEAVPPAPPAAAVY